MKKCAIYKVSESVSKILFAVIALLLSACSQPLSITEKQSDISLISYVDPFIGTDGKGKTYPGATQPYGMVQLSPDNGRNGWDWISGYFYPDNVIAGFSHTHLSGTGAGDLYDISFMPVTGKPRLEKLDKVKKTATLVSAFSHKNEQASPGYYQVYLDDYQVNVELTAGLRTGVQKYTFAPQHQTGQVKLDLSYSRNWDSTVATELTIINDHTIAGYRKSTGWAKDQRVYFYTVFSQPFDSQRTLLNGKNTQLDTLQGKEIEAWFSFNLHKQNTVEIKTAISSVSIENAQQNLLFDGIDKSFAQYRSDTEQRWEEALAKVEIQANNNTKVQFYTAMYHSYLAPRVFSDSNGQYKGPDGKIHQAKDHQRYSFFSLWDTFRALHPWKTITDAEHSKDMMLSLLDHYNEYGLLPVWNFQGNETDMMMGYHAVPVLADAYLKGIIDASDIDGEVLLDAMKKSAMQSDFSIDDYQSLGYVPYENGIWNVSLTLEYAFDDWSIAQLAQALGKKTDYDYFTQRSKNYQHHFDSQSNFMRAKSKSGQFKADFDPLAYHPEDYCEANAWQYNFFVPHDIEGLISLMGGSESFESKLDEMFSTKQSAEKLPEWISGYIGQYVHGNEPAHHVPYLYQYVNQPHKTQQRVRQIMQELYTIQPDGLAGNEDAGQMSAWYMFSALGFYPVNPVSGEYVFGSPMVEKATIKLADNKEFNIVALNQSTDNIYVKAITLNSQPYNKFTISHQDIIAGGELVFHMSSEP